VDSVDLGTSPRWKDLIFALTISTVAFTCLESASGLAGEVKVSRRALRRIVAAATATVIVIYVGVSLVAVAALPVTPGSAPLTGEALDAPMLPVVQTFRPEWVADAFTYITAALAAATLVVAANAAMLGLSRLAYALATNRQIPSAMGRLHPKTGTPYLVIFVGGALAAALVVPRDLDFLVGIYAIGAMLAFLLAHVSICVLRYREPELRRPFKIPFSVRVAGGELPLPSVLGALMAAVAIVSLLVFHEGARYVGLCWMAVGVGLYVTYRRRSEIPLLKRVVVPESALRAEAVDVEYGSILVPILGTPLDDDIVQTAGRLAAAGAEDRAAGAGAIIEALWVFEVPLSLPLDARLPDDQVKGARAALARAKAVGEEYEGVEVATAIVRSRRAGEAIVSEATRRGVEVIVMAAEEPTRIRGGAILGGKSGPRDNFVGEVTKYVVRKSPCRVILTAPPADDADLVSAVPDASH
jgi:APA family basic amino acid/polyamine antiporter